MRYALLAAAGAAALMAATPALAQPRHPSTEERLEALEAATESLRDENDRQAATIAAQQAEIAALRGQLGQATAQTAPVVQAAQGQEARIETLEQNVETTRLAAAEQPRWTDVAGRPVITTPDGRYTLGFRALVQGDAAHYVQDDETSLATDFRRGSVGAAPNREINGAKDLSDGMYFRRARLGIEGTFNRDWGYRLITEFAGSGTEGPARINDAWISYTGFAPFSIQVGAFSPPANMDDGTSPEDTLFLERATASELSRTMGGADGRTGIMVRFATQDWMGALTFTGRTVNDAEVFDSQAAVVGRVGHLLFTSDTYNVHIGASGTYVFSPADQGSLITGARYPLRLRDRPEIRVDSTRLIDTGSIDAQHAFNVGLEFGANWRNVYVQGEYFWYGIDRRQPTVLSDPTFGGFYIQGSWVITGEPHRYNMTNGSFQSPRPYTPFGRGGGLGAWELALRFSDIDLNYHEGVFGAASPADGIRGGEQQIWTLGLNWYPNTNVRLLFDYSHVEVDRLNPGGTAFGTAPSTPPTGVQIGQDLDIWAVRSQFSF